MKAYRFLVLAIIAVGAHAQQQVAFIGDNLTYAWQQTQQFQANTNWLPYGFTVPFEPGPGRGTEAALTELRAIIATGQKPIIHLMVGQADADGQDDGGNQDALVFAVFAHNMETIINTAQAAKLKIIIGTDPFAVVGNMGQFNSWLMQYCAAHEIPVVNYAAALRGAGFAASLQPYAPVFYTAPGPNDFSLPTLTPAGYALITGMAETQIGLTSGAFTLTHGYLSATILPDLEDPQSEVGGNTAIDGSTVQFTPFGQYSDGRTRIINNVGLNGDVGTWTSSNPAVIWIQTGQDGVAMAWAPGTANVHFVSPTGIKFNEWTMYVDVDDPCGCDTEF